jgi:hypothetical protein
MKAIYTNTDGEQFEIEVLSYNREEMLVQGQFTDTGGIHNFRLIDITMVSFFGVDYTLTLGGYNRDMGCLTMHVSRQYPDSPAAIVTEVPLYDVMDFILATYSPEPEQEIE